MSQLEIHWHFPLRWPEGRPRTPEAQRKLALWRGNGRPITLGTARVRLLGQLEMISAGRQYWRTSDHVVTSNIRFTRTGARDQNYRRDPDDPGVALYFRLDQQPLALACDRWTTVQDNIAAIAAHIEALRGQERWGVADLAQAFAGHVALPPPHPGQGQQTQQWWQVLGVTSSATPAEIDAAWRAKMRTAHPDHGGTDNAAARLNWARGEGKRANG